MLQFKIPMKLCDDCCLPTYSVTSDISKSTLYYCQNMFCKKYGKNVDINKS